MAVLINPISGKKQSRSLFKKRLEPLLKLGHLDYERIETTSPTFMDEWTAKVNPAETDFTDIVLIGGDGIYSQYINAVWAHPQREELLKLPIGLIPGGSTNALCCDIGGKNPTEASINVLRGNPMRADMMLTKFRKQKKEVLCSVLTWGIVGDIVHDAERWRGVFGSTRYAACGLKTFACSAKMKSYQAHVHYRNNAEFLDSHKPAPLDEEEKGSPEDIHHSGDEEVPISMDDIAIPSLKKLSLSSINPTLAPSNDVDSPGRES